MRSRTFRLCAKPVTRSKREPTTRQLAILDARILATLSPESFAEVEAGELDAELYESQFIRAMAGEAL